jgi:K+-transporting ATPase ATPase B chain
MSPVTTTPQATPNLPLHEDPTSLIPKKLARSRPLFDPEIVSRAVRASFGKLNPVTLAKNPVMFVVEVGALLTTVSLSATCCRRRGPEVRSADRPLALVYRVIRQLRRSHGRSARQGASRQPAQDQDRRVGQTLTSSGKIEEVTASALRAGDVVTCDAGELIPGDGEVIDGIATVDESVITGESAPVIRESGGDRSAVTGGTRVLSDHIKVRITSNPGETFLDRMIALVEGAERQKTPNEIALNILIAGLTLIFLLAVVTLQPYAVFSVAQAGAGTVPSVAVLVSLLVCLIPTTIGGLLSPSGSRAWTASCSTTCSR